MPGDALLRYAIPIPQSTLEAQELMGVGLEPVESKDD